MNRCIARCFSIVSLCGFLILSGISCGGLAEMHYDLCQTAPICVDSTSGSDAYDGRGWGTPVKTLSRALQLVSEGGEIWVKESAGNTAGAVLSKNNVGIYGGFKGTESRRDERSSSDSSAVSGSISSADVITVNANISGIVLDGLQFSGFSNTGYATVKILPGANVTVRSCRFSNNTNNHQIYSAVKSSVTVSDCTFTGNTTASNGAGMFILGNAGILSSVFSNNSSSNPGGAIALLAPSITTISDSTLLSNYTTGTAATGGAIFSTGFLTISESTISSNYTTGASAHGGGLYINSGTATISDSTINGNTSAGDGGALFLNASPSVTISNTSLKNNSAVSNGGGIRMASGTLTITKCSLESNSSTIASGGAIFCYNGSTINIFNSYILSNHADFTNCSAGFIYLQNDISGPSINVNVYNSLISGNSCDSAFKGSVARFFNSITTGILSFFNCTIIDPYAVNNPFGLINNTTNFVYCRNSIVYSASSSLSDSANTCTGYNSYTNVSPGQTGFTVLSALSNEFADFSGGDYRLSSSSQLINAGNNSYVYGSYDLDNTARVKGGTVDIGAFERR